MFVVSLLLSFAQFVGAQVCFALAQRKFRIVPVLVCAGVLVSLVAPLLALSAALLVVVGVACRFAQFPLRTHAAVSLGALAAAYLIAGRSILERDRVRANLRQQYPYISLRDRLAYETGDAAQSESTPREQHRDVVFRSHRSRALAAIHSDFVTQFLESPGFGVGRMSFVRMYAESYVPIVDPPQIPITKEAATPDATPIAGVDGAGQPHQHMNLPESEALTELHQRGVDDFADPQTFGHIESVDRVAGFVPHRFTHMPTLSPQAPSNDWSVASVELISLLKHEAPVVYLSDHLPRMKELVEAPTRSLDAFEAAALKALATGKALEVESSSGQIRMLGPLRASRDCLECHAVKPGDLLGAFSYRMRNRVNPPATKLEEQLAL